MTIKHHGDKILLWISVYILPNIFFLFLFHSNISATFIMFSHVLVVGTILGIVSVLMFVLLSLLTKCHEGGFLLNTFFWLFFWLFRPIFNFVVNATQDVLELNRLHLLLLGGGGGSFGFHFYIYGNEVI